MDNELVFAEETPKTVNQYVRPWKILIVDDEVDVHKVTELALKRFEFGGQGLVFYNAYSAEQAQVLLAEHPDFAIILLDVVMESDHAGLDLVQYIRQVCDNHTSRIVLRTGQPGQAPERKVIQDYDVNDYKDKTELTSQKLYTLIYACLRSYRDIITLERSKLGLEQVIHSSRNVFEQRGFKAFVKGVMNQLGLLLHLEGSSIYTYEHLALLLQDTELTLLADMTGEHHAEERVLKISDLPPHVRSIIGQAVEARRNVYEGNKLVIYCSNKEFTTLFFVEGIQGLSELDVNLLNLFTENIVVALENIRLKELIRDSNKEVIYRLGEVIETRSKETGFHVKRVALYCELLAQLYGLSDKESDILKQASPLHDIGKVGIPDVILNKPGRLDAEQWSVMRQHAQIGYDILAESGNRLLDAASIIALNHHEKWDGSGYPNGLRGEDIPIYGRIVALADVFDAVGSQRCYKEPWPLEEVFAFIRDQRGAHFDPQLVDLFFDNIDRFLAIRETYQDECH